MGADHKVIARLKRSSCGPVAVPLSSTYSCIAAELFRSRMVGIDNQ